jgi:hypothetical protein
VEPDESDFVVELDESDFSVELDEDGVVDEDEPRLSFL